VRVSPGRCLVALVLLAAVAAAGALHHHEDLAGTLAGAGVDRIVSSHNPLSNGTHWHSDTHIKDDPCLACSSHRGAGMPAAARFIAPLLTSFSATATRAASSSSFARLPHGSRAPPALL
jgi:hypothetical protein